MSGHAPPTLPRPEEELPSTFMKELDRLASTSFRQLRRSDAQHVFQLLRDEDVKAVASPHARAPDAAAAAAPTSTSSCAQPAPSPVAVQRRLALLERLTMQQQDTLMKVLYACMAPPSATEEQQQPQERKESGEWLRAVYDWHAVLYQVSGDGAVVRVFASR
ncbi:putative ARP2/3 complex 16kDa subunit [Leptomonas pyrrhocoris]|uniref:Putative ARP2/3 complex 16kDa subunit n=1 Tax=Leptomonas pyrrhocoris TaxID=157538 RepID=A0A0N0DVS4_LEPPY|nr:putative ARP2/3 complex 16kDa subunit [Leptomonas pyrrhocoris]XP_015659223.1 putative ARP2/3 complex 16kDa subunit [Leptomonas pyrrhocoris]KPA80783.1 putative ARP2/3 complex 16kDa subunit [Leptomonas pyrrhocoris]KPA80784.1 putative ARP2/3 complex 16kDa subunit [Leptomonas pyrrhocoris]|eukprot:XP_015659222.1 putative ARP2/3 complex 16kDa subunit [Leptomonas pyrrhocoris]